MTYKLTSIVSSQPTNILSAELEGISGKSLRSVASIDTFYYTSVNGLTANVNKGLPLASLNTDLILKAVSVSSIGATESSSSIYIEVITPKGESILYSINTFNELNKQINGLLPKGSTVNLMSNYTIEDVLLFFLPCIIVEV